METTSLLDTDLQTIKDLDKYLKPHELEPKQASEILFETMSSQYTATSVNSDSGLESNNAQKIEHKLDYKGPFQSAFCNDIFRKLTKSLKKADDKMYGGTKEDEEEAWI